MQLQKPQICPICKKQEVSGKLAKDGITYICYSCKESGK